MVWPDCAHGIADMVWPDSAHGIADVVWHAVAGKHQQGGVTSCTIRHSRPLGNQPLVQALF